MSKKSEIARLLGERIKEIRTARGLTQEELGHLANLHPSHMGQIERAERIVSVETVEKLVHALDISYEEIFEFAEVNRKHKESSIMLEIFDELSKQSVADQKFALSILKSMFDWKNG